MVLSQKILNQINELYEPSGSFIYYYLLPTIIIIIWLYNILSLLVSIEINSSKENWSQNKCTPKYLFFSGLIQPEPGLGKVGSTRKNFKDCVLKA